MFSATVVAVNTRLGCQAYPAIIYLFTTPSLRMAHGYRVDKRELRIRNVCYNERRHADVVSESVDIYRWYRKSLWVFPITQIRVLACESQE